jgi:hypothetical protein
MIKSERMRWARYVARIGTEKNTYRVLVGKLEEKRLIGRHRRRWYGNNVTYLNNTLPGNSSVNTVQHATIGEAVFYVVRAEQRWNNGVMQPVSKQRLGKHISAYRTVLRKR